VKSKKKGGSFIGIARFAGLLLPFFQKKKKKEEKTWFFRKKRKKRKKAKKRKERALHIYPPLRTFLQNIDPTVL